MEECTTSLGDIIELKRDNGDLTPYSPDIIHRVGFDISNALNYLHNVILLLHCDIKSFNILVKDDFKICKLCDFGVCLPLKKDGTIDEQKTGEEYEYVGTLAWSAPEILKFPQHITSKADIYSFGIVLYETLTLSIPISDELLNSLEISSEDEEYDLCSKFEENQLVLPNIELGSEYNIILEIMHRCASHNLENRPSAKDLEVIFSDLKLLSSSV
ncbi:hypothetical protein HHI36_010918 [Cryptolaemus montrouzieri]|uniref:Protein kinase domain-containing protein n=1 Tax=Cryptolaemus montrouzieri TaxID=559131 RepID=A0ABD2MKA0_9CUCU